MRVLCINGPNLDLLGVREPHVYGTTTLAELEQMVADWGEKMGIACEHLQSNHEGEMIEAVHGSDHDAIILNPGALTHTSRALADAVNSIAVPVVEVHISNVREREAWRRHSVLEEVAAWSIYGRGLAGYRDALRHLVNRSAVDFETVPYGPHPETIGDLRRGGGGLAVLVHGGFWRHEWKRDTTESLAVDLTQRGFDTWNIEYRRLGAGGGWPGSGHDVQMALDFITQLGVDPDPLIVIGHSAGGYLAQWAVPRTVNMPTRLIALATVGDLSMLVREGSHGAEEASQLLSSGAPERTRPVPVPVDLTHGRDDELVPVEHSEILAGTAGVDMQIVPGGHFELLDPGREQWETALRSVY